MMTSSSERSLMLVVDESEAMSQVTAYLGHHLSTNAKRPPYVGRGDAPI